MFKIQRPHPESVPQPGNFSPVAGGCGPTSAWTPSPAASLCEHTDC